MIFKKKIFRFSLFFCFAFFLMSYVIRAENNNDQISVIKSRSLIDDVKFSSAKKDFFNNSSNDKKLNKIQEKSETEGIKEVPLSKHLKEHFVLKDIEAHKLLNKAEDFFKENNLTHAASEFVKNSWRIGDIFVFLIDSIGICYAFGSEKSRIWTNFSNFKDVMGRAIIEEFLKKDQENITSFLINNSTLYCRLKKVKKDNKIFILGTAFYPKDPLYNSIDLVRRTVELLEDVGVDRAISVINDPFGPLTRSGVYVDLLDSDGIILAHGGERARVGQSVYDPREQRLTAIAKYRDFILKRFAKRRTNQLWFSYKSKKAVEKLFVERYVDLKTQKTYFVCSIVYPDISEKDVFNLVQMAIRRLSESKDLLKLYQIFTEKREGFRIGPAAISVYDMNGLCLANGENPEFVGQNRLDYTDKMGRQPIKEIIDSVKTGEFNWLTIYEKNGDKLIYAEKVDLVDTSLVVISGFWPLLPICVQNMVERAALLLEKKGISEAFKRFKSRDYDFFQGDVYPIIFTPAGTILINGPFQTNLCKSYPLKDGTDVNAIKKLIKQAGKEGKWSTFKQFNANYRAFIKTINIKNPDKTKSKLIVSSGYYSLI